MHLTFVIVKIKKAALKHLTFTALVVMCLSSCDEPQSTNQKAAYFIGKNPDSVSYYLEVSKSTSVSKNELLEIQVLEGILLFSTYQFDSGYQVLLHAHRQLLETSHGEFAGYASTFIGRYHRIQNQMDSAVMYHSEALELLKDTKNFWFIQGNETGLALALNKLGRYEESIPHYQKSLEYDTDNTKRTNAFIGLSDVHRALGDAESSLEYALKAKRRAEQYGKKYAKSVAYEAVANAYAQIDQPDSALFYMEQVLELLKAMPTHLASFSSFAGTQALRLENYDRARIHFRNAINSSALLESRAFISGYHNDLAKTFRSLGQHDSTLHYARLGLDLSRANNEQPEELQALELMAESFKEMSQPDSALFYMDEAKTLQYEIFNAKLVNEVSDLKVQVATAQKETELQAAKTEQIKAENQRKFAIGSGLFVVVILGLAFIRYRRTSTIKQELLQTEKRLLTAELDRNKQLLSTQTLNMIHKNNGFSEIAENLKEVNGSGRKIKSIIDVNMALEKDWDNFNLYFSQVHSSFYSTLSENHPSLSVNDKRLCALVKMGLTNKEISSILNIKYESINMAKYRLKKKMELKETEDVNEYLTRL